MSVNPENPFARNKQTVLEQKNTDSNPVEPVGNKPTVVGNKNKGVGNKKLPTNISELWTIMWKKRMDIGMDSLISWITDKPLSVTKSTIKKEPKYKPRPVRQNILGAILDLVNPRGQ